MKTRKMLSDWEAPYIQNFLQAAKGQSKRTLAGFAVAYAQEKLLPVWENAFPRDERPALALQAARNWLDGNGKLPKVKQAILACHSAARQAEQQPAAQAAARAIGQAAAAIHTPRHVISLPLYGALSLAYHALGDKADWASLEARAATECERMRQALREVSAENEPTPQIGQIVNIAMKTDIKKINKSQLQQALSVIHRSFATVADEMGLTAENCPRHPSFMPAEALERKFADGYAVFGCFINNEMVGVAALSTVHNEPAYAHLHHICVLPGFRHKKLGKRLLEFAEKQAIKAGCQTLKIEIIEDNTVLKKWYLQNGFIETATSKMETLPFSVGYLEKNIKK